MTSQHEGQSTGSADGGQRTDQKPDIGQLEAEIEQTRQELGETVEALTAKLDVKSRARARLNDTKQRASVQLNETRQRASVQLGEAQRRARVQATQLQSRATDLTASARKAATTDDGRPAPAVLGGVAAVVLGAAVATSLVLWRRRR
jgi:chromosome segregation ATPase